MIETTGTNAPTTANDPEAKVLHGDHVSDAPAVAVSADIEADAPDCINVTAEHVLAIVGDNVDKEETRIANRDVTVARILDVVKSVAAEADKTGKPVNAQLDTAESVHILASSAAQAMGIDSTVYSAARSVPSRYTFVVVDDGDDHAIGLAFKNLESLLDLINSHGMGLTVISGITAYAAPAQPGVARAVSVDLHMATLQCFQKPEPAPVFTPPAAANDPDVEEAAVAPVVEAAAVPAVDTDGAEA